MFFVSEPAEEDPQENEEEGDPRPDRWETIEGLRNQKGLRQNPKGSSLKRWGIQKLDPYSTPKLGFRCQSFLFILRHP